MIGFICFKFICVRVIMLLTAEFNPLYTLKSKNDNQRKKNFLKNGTEIQ